MSKVNVEIDIPDGFEFVRIGSPTNGEWFTSFNKDTIPAISDSDSIRGTWVILKKRVTLISKIDSGCRFMFCGSDTVYHKVYVKSVIGRMNGFLYKKIDGDTIYFSSQDLDVILL